VDDKLWGAPVIRAPISERVSVTARGSRAEAERLAAGLRAGSLPAPIQLVYSGGDSTALNLTGGPE
jgi:preprotein translocase subunit SecD